MKAYQFKDNFIDVLQVKTQQRKIRTKLLAVDTETKMERIISN